MLRGAVTIPWFDLQPTFRRRSAEQHQARGLYFAGTQADSFTLFENTNNRPWQKKVSQIHPFGGQLFLHPVKDTGYRSASGVFVI